MSRWWKKKIRCHWNSSPSYVILYTSLQTDDGEDDLKKGTQLLEIYALEIQMYTAQKNNKKLKALYEQSLHIKSAIPHPLIMGVIRGECLPVCPCYRCQSVRDVSPTFPPECGGKMHLREGEFEKAHTDFFEAFKNYDESGSPRRTTCLKYLVLANMLMKSGINPFDSQEVWKNVSAQTVFSLSMWSLSKWSQELVVDADTLAICIWSFDSLDDTTVIRVLNMWGLFCLLKAKPYKNDPEILAMTNLVR